MNRTINEIVTPKFRSVTRREAARLQHRFMYEQLAETLGGLTTVVLVDELLESSPDPHMVRARQRCVYPPQPPANTRIVDNYTEERQMGGREMTMLTLRRKFRTDAALGYLSIDYSEEVGLTQHGISLSVYSMDGKGTFSPEILTAIGAVFGTGDKA